MKLVDPFPDRYQSHVEQLKVAAGVPVKGIGLIDNSKGVADIVVDEIGRRLCEKFGLQSVSRRKPTFTVPATSDELTAVSENADLVITAVGD
jgi:hypothetical protein